MTRLDDSILAACTEMMRAAAVIEALPVRSGGCAGGSVAIPSDLRDILCAQMRTFAQLVDQLALALGGEK